MKGVIYIDVRDLVFLKTRQTWVLLGVGLRVQLWQKMDKDFLFYFN
jgi:hypothetical protein